MTIQTQFIFDDDGKKIGAIIPIEDYDNFVKPSKEGLCQLSAEQKNAIDEALDELNAGKGIPHQDVMKQTKEKYPNLFQ
jgi:hypothetical protein